MKFSTQREVFLQPLSQVIGVVERRQTLPVLANFLIVAQGKRLSVTGTDNWVASRGVAKRVGSAGAAREAISELKRSAPASGAAMFRSITTGPLRLGRAGRWAGARART